MEDELIFYKVYEDKNNIEGRYYVDTLEGVKSSLWAWQEGLEARAEGDDLFPVIEPVLMTQSSFDALPEFTGY